ncbi:hypothetical protein PMAYCL1PPCAC_23530 [Pristionchus mayeri]|uniref:Mediator of RNA polymerase II transcription subunit 23 n=1 Tax=Pristionchus mayeri TaxID=1317129 RepID=A0AAN5D003_9BILA|nr:hypothetical protein PMAYCL1PPCAC_23530 [Pristionchus mayeri]
MMSTRFSMESSLFDFGRLISDHVNHASTRLNFNEKSEDDGVALQLLCLRFQAIFKIQNESIMLESEKAAEQKLTVDQMIEVLMSEESSKRHIMEKTIDKIFEEAHKARVIQPLTMMNARLATCDFTLKNPFDSCKLHKMKRDLDLLNYKGVRTFFKQLYEKMTAVPQEITPEQREFLTPVQELLLYIMRRDSNVIPALFVATEINNMTRQRALMFSRVMETATQMENTFRPLAELSYVTARSYLFPIVAHPSFVTTSQLWKLDPSCTIMTHRLHLPFRIELYSPQSFALQMVIKQQRNRDAFRSMLRSGGRDPTKMALDNIVLFMIGNAMLFMERFPSHSECVSSMWNQITDALNTLLGYGWCDISRFISVLAKTIHKSEYRRARDEVMWTLLQNIKHLRNRNGDDFNETLQSIAAIYSYLYEKEETSVMSSDCPLKMVKTLSAACLWIDLSSGTEDSLPPPSPFLATQIQFITGSTNSLPTNDKTMLAVIVNAYINSSTRGDLKQAAIDSLLFKLNNEGVFNLNDHKTFNNFSPFEYELLHALGLKGQAEMLIQLLTEMKKIFTVDPSTILPSPAIIETAARLACMSENEKAVGSQFARVVEEGAKEGGFRSPHFLFIIVEMISFRCFNLTQNSRANVITGAFQMLLKDRLDNNPESQGKGIHLLQSFVRTQYDLYSALELLVVRLCSWLPPTDSISFITNAVVRTLMANKYHVLVDGSPPNFYDILNFPHDLAKALFVSYLRSSKLLGQEVPFELLKRINNCYYWSHSQTRFLNEKLEPNPPNFEEQESKAFEQYIQLVHRDSTQMRGLPEQAWPDYFKDQIPPDAPVTLLSAHFRNIYNGRSTTPQERTAILSTLKQMDVPHQISAINSFVDYLAQEAKKDKESFAAACSKQLVELLIIDEIIPIDRFFFTAAFTARSDESTLAVLSLVRAVVRHPSYVEMTQQMTSLPKIGSSDFIKKMNELKTRRRTSHASHHRIHDIQPSYYGHPLLKILSSTDTLIERALQLNVPDEHFKELVDAFSPLYRFHPYPLTYCLSVMHLLYGHTDDRDVLKEVDKRQQILKMRPRGRMMVLAVVKYDAGQCPFSPQFVSNQSIVDDDARTIALSLTNNLVATFYIGHCPDDSLSADPRCTPSFYSGDWRSSELSPQGHALYSIACEILASPLSNEVLGRAFINILYMEDVDRPLLYLNAVSLILTTLPYNYTHFLFDEIISLFGDPIGHLSIDQIIMETYERTVNRKRATRVHTIIALSQAFWHHATVPILISFVSRFEEELERRVKTEKDLFLSLHILIPLLQRIADAKEKSHIDRCFRMVLLIYRLLQKIAVHEITKEDAICDLLYHFKYMFVGDFVKKDINEIIDSMSDSLKRKLKFIVQSTEGKVNEDHDTSERKDSVI